MAADYDTKVYVEVGGDKLVVADGGEIEIQDGGTLDILSGANFHVGTFGGSMVVNQTDNYPLGIFGNIVVAQTTGSTTQRGIWARMDVDANLSGTSSVTGAELQFRFDGATSIGSGTEAEQYSGAWLYFEQDTSGDTLADYCHASASFASVETHSDLSLSANTHLSGIEIASRLGASNGVAWADTTGTTAALFITKAPAATGVTASDWPYGIVIENCTTGINLAGCTGIGSNIILGGYGRISTSTYEGAALAITDTFTEDSGLYLRYAVASMTGSIFYGAWIRAETSADISTKRLTGLEVYGTSAYTCGELRAIQAYAMVKDGTATETVGPIYGVSAELTFEAGTATKTITTEAMPLRVKITGGKVDSYTKIHGIQLMAGDMNAASPTYGYAIEIKDGPEAGTVTWTTGLRITSPCTTGIDLGDSCTTGILLGDCTTGINLNGTTGTVGILMDATTGAVFSLGLKIYGSADQSIYVAQYMPETNTIPVEFYGLPTNKTGESSQGVLQICIKREASCAMTATTGNPDTVLRLRGKNEADNTVARGGLRGIELEVENNRDEEGGGNAINAYIHGAVFTAGNTGDVVTQCDDMQVLQLNMNNQGVVDTSLYGLRVLEKSEGTIPTDTVGIKVTTATTAPANIARADGIMITTGGATGGWTDGLHIAGTITNAINISGTTIATGINIGACGTACINIATGQTLGINIAGTTTAGILKAGVSDGSLISGGLGAPAIATSWVGIGIFGTLTGADGRLGNGGYPEDHGVNIVLKEDGQVQFMYAIQGRAYVIGDGAGQDGVAQEIFGLYGRARIDDDGTVGYGSNGQAIGVYGLCYLRVGGTSDVGGSGVLAGGRFSYKDQGITHTTSGVRCGIMAEVEEGSPECIMYLLAHSGAGTIANAIDINDAGNDVTNLLKLRQANGCGTDISSWYADTHQPDGSLQIDVANTTYWIPIYSTRHGS